MKGWGLQVRIWGAIGLIIVVALGISTLLHIRDRQADYFNAMQGRSEALAQSLVSDLRDIQEARPNIKETSSALSEQCAQLQVLNRTKALSHIAVIDASGEIIAHNNPDLLHTTVDPVVRDALARKQRTTVLQNAIYHTLVPAFTEQGDYLATIDIGIPQRAITGKEREIILKSLMVWVIILSLTCITIFVLIRFMVAKPLRKLVEVGEQLTEGGGIPRFRTAQGKDEIALLRAVFTRLADYLQHIAMIATQIATGQIDEDIPLRSNQDPVGKALQEMRQYLKQVAVVATKVADGDLTRYLPVRSTSDAVGKTLQTMTEGLRLLIEHIKTNTAKIDTIRTNIASLTSLDSSIVERMHASIEKMMVTTRELGISVGEVAHNINTLSSSVHDASDAVFLMTSSVTLISANATELTNRAHQTIESLKEAVEGLEGVVKNTDISKTLSQETIHDALAGQEAFEQVTVSMEKIRQTITTAVETITRFAQRSGEIDTILEVIREITDQTALLALNASIISAQAGVHGRGFAVIADEIKNLADGVGASTKDIAKIVHTLQQDTKSVVKTIHEGAADVKLGMERTRQAQEMLKKIIESAKRSSTVVTEIAEALRKVMTTSHDVALAMEEVNAMVEDFTVATNEQEQSTGQINEAITHINDMISEIQQSTADQSDEVRSFLEATNEVTTLLDQTLESSQQIAQVTTELSSHAEALLRSVDRFKLS